MFLLHQLNQLALLCQPRRAPSAFVPRREPPISNTTFRWVMRRFRESTRRPLATAVRGACSVQAVTIGHSGLMLIVRAERGACPVLWSTCAEHAHSSHRTLSMSGAVVHVRGACSFLGPHAEHVHRARALSGPAFALDSGFAVGKHGARGVLDRVEPGRLKFDTSTIPEGALFGRQIYYQEPGGSFGRRDECLHGRKPAG